MQRRNILKILGSSAVIMAAGGGGWALTRTPTAALAPWDMAGSADYADPRVRALSYAILAPNPHNRQPWVVDLGTPGEATLYCDLDRLLPATDPFSRQIVIGLGCFLELLRQAAAEDGFLLDVTPFPEGEDAAALDARPIAHIRFLEGARVQRDPLFAQVLARRSNKETYDTSRGVSNDTLEVLRVAAGGGLSADATNDTARVQSFRDLTWAALQIEMLTDYTMQESIDLMRIGKREINQNPDGIELGGAMFEALNIMGLMTREALEDETSTAFRQGLAIMESHLMSAMAYIWVKTPGNSRVDQLNAGRAWVRINLKATELGVGLHPLSQALQEYPEMDALFADMRDQAGVAPGETLQMFGRLGYGPSAPRTPRWPVDTRILGAS